MQSAQKIDQRDMVLPAIQILENSLRRYALIGSLIVALVFVSAWVYVDTQRIDRLEQQMRVWTAWEPWP
jgi:hypothetical protein